MRTKKGLVCAAMNATARRRRYDPGHVKHLLARDERSASWLARKVGVSPSHLHRVVRGDRQLTDDLATAIASVFGVDISDLEEQA